MLFRSVVLGGPTGIAGGDQLADLVSERIRQTTRWTPTVAASTIKGNPILGGAKELLVADVRTQLLESVAKISA